MTGVQRRLDPAHGGVQRIALGASHVPLHPTAVDLLGDVGEVEVRRERSGQANRGRDVDPVEQDRGGAELLARGVAHLLDEGEQVGRVLAHEGRAEQLTEDPDVGTHVGEVITVDDDRGRGGGEEVRSHGVRPRGRQGDGAAPVAHRRTA